ncbi:patatin-like phospholipase family protein [Halomonas sp. EGI 63088]|uniref:Patatin-like phospholipase family protein n=1 Tax=Halomonas flagellata TaxID=2920385 RepID=A0ABS9RZ44_9GAMM|nr:patatin-like phospholipase family protein [Halomonas flagellata]MCH4565122.1 patatin-like phospholipase family protein [Halomonas flagellata]
MRHVTLAWMLAATLPLMPLAGCAAFPETRPLERVDAATGYRYANLADAGQDEDLFVILTFSGGGTRAAALAHGVLERLRDAWVEIDGERRNLLDEVDVISSVSGGSFTAAYYGLHGDALFDPEGRFHRNFLYRDVEARLKGQLFNPYNWARLASKTFGRIDIADEVYQDLLFDDADFGDLTARGRKPFLLINATDMAKGSRFTFVQSQFDPMCADLDRVTLSRAVAASSNFPVAFTPLALNSYPGRCDYREPAWVAAGLRDLEANPRRYYRARSLRDYQAPERRYVHLLDGGVADNIGLRYPLTAIRSTDVPWSVLRKINLEQIDKLVVIVVDAKTQQVPDFDTSPRAPGLTQVVSNIATTPMANYSFDTVELLRQTLRTRADAQQVSRETAPPDEALHRVELYRIYVGFDQLQDEAQRERFLSLPTTFRLPAGEVDDLRRIGGVLLERSPCFQSLVGGHYDEPACVQGVPSPSPGAAPSS